MIAEETRRIRYGDFIWTAPEFCKHVMTTVCRKCFAKRVSNGQHIIIEADDTAERQSDDR